MHLLFCPILAKVGKCGQIPVKVPNTKSHKNLSGTHTDMTKLTAAFRNCLANAPAHGSLRNGLQGCGVDAAASE